jgi:hypothetical protein
MLLAQSFRRREPPFHCHPQNDVYESTNAGLCLKHPSIDAERVASPVKDNNRRALGLGATTRDQVDRLLSNLDRPSSTSSHHNQSQIVRDPLHDCDQRLSLSDSHRTSLGLHHHRAALFLNCRFDNLCRLSLALHLCKPTSNQMAPNGHAPAGPKSGDRSHQPGSRQVWHENHGITEFKNWQEENPTQHLSYDDWKSSQHVAGLSLYYAAMQIWEESDSSVGNQPIFATTHGSNYKQDEEIEQHMVASRPYAARAQSAREPKKTLKPNGHGLLRSKGSATPSAAALSEDLSPSSKKKRKTKKKFLVCRPSKTLHSCC